ncbi:hypothetical protein FNZ56_09505 [Pseudoluteimonas lycopersici]|uniref:PKD domain-containing protein n=1 Tax=Pseudoluteimonas lycopersici TaxID=1324796 RepID=A0A516V6D0_9GAMM|nr:hypothetical protein [Lysobacter lycopersici]QDQ74099.1 hypothetical protein FNZ56_09505 [Lysobacter lycopersici]
MIRNRISLAIATALLATVALAGCKKKDDAAMTTPPASEPAAPAPAEPMPAPAPTPATVASVDLGNAVGADNKVTTASTSFAKNDTIHASVATDGAASKLNAKWTYQDGQTVDSQDKDVAAGPQTTDFSISKPDGWPAGKYKVEISLDGSVVQSRDFEVK